MKAPSRGAAVLLAFALAACGASTRQKTITASFKATNTLRTSFDAWDLSYQQSLIAHDETKEDMKAAVAAYRTKRAPVFKAFVDVYAAITAVLLDTNLALTTLVSAGTTVKNLVEDIEKLKPGGTTAPPAPTTPAPPVATPSNKKANNS